MGKHSIEFRTLPAEKLSLLCIKDGGYNRGVDGNKVKKILAEFDDDLVNAIKVSYRDNHFHIIDGQHTLAAMRTKYGDNVEVWCKVYYGLTLQEEAELYLKQNGVSSAPKASEKLYAKKNVNDESAAGLFKILDKYGIELSTQFSVGNHRVSCGATLQKYYSIIQEDKFDMAFRLISKTWDCDRESLYAAFIGGMCEFTVRYGDKINEDEFVNRMKNHTSRDIYSNCAFSARYAGTCAIARIKNAIYDYVKDIING